MEMFYENLIKILLAVVVGGVIGAEREYQDKAAGFRTIILITLGSALFTIFSVTMDPGFTRSRVAANIVTGIGFLGAGAIVREGGKIGGLTTAATIWLSAALGMGIGAGDVYISLTATVITLLVLLVLAEMVRPAPRWGLLGLLIGVSAWVRPEAAYAGNSRRRGPARRSRCLRPLAPTADRCR